jgi:indolepyruvate decarboxylase
LPSYATNVSFTVADYILHRLDEVGVRHVFGVPGDYNLHFLDYVIRHERITWVGNANELNAAYAADGYARVNGVGAVLTTFGVGELSAINGIAGSHAEYLPVIHIVGAPSTRAQQERALVHHTLGDGDFGHFSRAYAEVTVAHAALTVANAAAEIDRVICTALRERRPGYLVVPVDVGASPIAPPVTPLRFSEPPFSEKALDAFVARVREMLGRAGSAVVLADFLADRFDVKPQLRRLLQAGRFPHTTLSMGKGLLDETDPDFFGTFAGRASAPQVRDCVVNADVIIAVGVRFTDTAMAGSSQDIADQRLIDVQPFAARIAEESFAPLPMARALDGLIAVVEELGRTWQRAAGKVQQRATRSDGRLSQVELWSQIEQFLRPNDIVVAEQGTAFFGAALMRLPKGVQFIGQPLWASIGYSLPAAYGAQIAAPQRRVVLLIGDGAAQLTAQEIGSMLRDGVKPVIVLINNDGYTIERVIHGATQRYNDIAPWHWSLLLQAMGAATRSLTLRADSTETLEIALMSAAKADCLVFLEAQLPKMDVPVLLATLAEAIRPPKRCVS